MKGLETPITLDFRKSLKLRMNSQWTETTFLRFSNKNLFKKVNNYKVAKKTIHKSSLDHNMIVTKVGVTLGPSTRKIDKSREDTAKDSQPIIDAAPINRKLSNCEKTRVHHRKIYVA
jgi:hypothetical protein